MWNLAVMAVSLIAVVIILFGVCSFYNHPYPDTRPSTAGFEIRSVQIDDFGTFWEPSKAQDVLSAVEAQSLSLTSSTFVVVFIHGWHHNAAPADSNLLDFNTWLSNLSKELARPERRATRQRLTGSPDFKLVGIYVGWRGRSLPWYFDYGTMWWRKTAAERVGDGDLSEFLERLQRIYLRANAFSRYLKNPGNTPFTGLFTLGHSFGGQALLKAVARPLESHLAMRAPRVSNATAPATRPSTPTLELVPIDSFGDLNVLVNPATEAYQFARIDDLYRQLAYPSEQTPQLVVFSADNDVPRQFFFPIARGLTSPFRPSFRNSYQGILYGSALGELTAQQTHALRLAEGSPDSLTDDDFKPENRSKVAQYDFTAQTIFSEVQLTRLPNTAVIENSPVAVIYADKTIINGHNGVFDKNFLAFLPQYIAFIEGKRIVLRYEKFRAMVSQGKSEDGTVPQPPACQDPSL